MFSPLNLMLILYWMSPNKMLERHLEFSVTLEKNGKKEKMVG